MSLKQKSPHLSIAKQGSMKEVKKCLECGSEELYPINFSSNECIDCGFQQSIKMPKYESLDRNKLRKL